MVALEDNLLILLVFMGVLAAVAGLGVALWKPVLRRAWAYLLLWWERDKIAEAEAVRLRECRAQAEAEITGEADVPGETVAPVCTAPTDETPLLQKVRR
ncbi:MAG: hypothetical protein H7Y38_15505 [Armatimonadetes bacterium]|nr:hypothetical protein [Armatimonadota bacterium]